MQTSLTAREVQEAIEERISKGLYALGHRLPPLRSMAAELGTSPSTVSRAVQEMIRNGWLEVQERQFVRVRSHLPHKPLRNAEIQRAIKSIAHKWKLWGGGEKELLHDIREIVAGVFEDEAQFVFTECNTHDLNHLGKQLASELSSLSIARTLIEDLDLPRLRQNKSVILVPYYHYAEVKEIVGQEVSIVPVHTSPSAETLDALLTIKPRSKVLVVGHNKRSVTRLSGMVRDYGGSSIPGSSAIRAEHLVAMQPHVPFHVNGGPTAVPDEDYRVIIEQTEAALQVCTAGNLRTTLLCANLAHELGVFDRFIIATDTPTGSGVMPLGMLYTIAHCASLTALPPEWFVCAATGSNARVYRLNSGLLAAGRDADIVLIDAPSGGAKSEALDAMRNGDIAAVSAVITNGVPRFVGKSRNTPAGVRRVRVAECRLPQDFSG